MKILNYIFKFKNKIIFIENKRNYSCKFIQNNIFFYKEKVQKKKLVLMICRNTFESVIMYLFCLYNNNAVILLDFNINEEYLKKIIKNYKPTYLYLPFKINLYLKNYKIIYSNTSFNLMEITNGVNYKVNKKLAVLIPTSGSTGNPKMVRLSYKNLDSNTLAISKYLKISNKDKTITSLSFNYSYGLSIINSHILKGAKIVLNEFSMFEKKFWDIVKNMNVNNFACVPYNIDILFKIGFFKSSYPNLKYITIAGGPLNVNLWKDLIQKRKKLQIFVMYGQSEASPRISYLPSDMFDKKIGSIGIPIPGGKLKIKNKNNYKHNQFGELIYQGENVFLGYAKNYKSLLLNDLFKGILKTGDIAYKDSDGFYYLKGRIKRISKIFGLRINLDDIENKLLSKKINSICISNDKKIFIFMINSSKNIKINKNQVSELISLSSRFIEIKIIKEFPLTANNKIDYNSLYKEIT